MMSRLWLCFAAVCLTWCYTEAYYPTVFALPGTCGDNKLVQDVLVMEGVNSCKFGEYDYAFMMNDWVLGNGERLTASGCKMDLCLVPESGPVVDGYVWGIKNPASDEVIDDADKVGIVIFIEKTVCELLSDDLYVTADSMVYCRVDLVRQPGTDKKNLTNILFLAGAGQCPEQSEVGDVQYIMHWAIREKCQSLGGIVIKDTPYCVMQLCYSSAVQCEPSDTYVFYQSCHHRADDAAEPTECIYEVTTGVSMMKGSSSESSEELSTGVSLEVGLALGDIFSSTMTASVSSTFSWSNIYSLESTLTTTTKQQITMKVRPGYVGKLKQLYGICGQYRIKTNEWFIEKCPLSDPNCY